MTTLQGIDVSHWQPSTPPLAGLSFLFAKATEGTWFVDPLYATHTAAARAAGLVAGAFHFGVDVDPIAQARNFLAVAGGAGLLALDLENSPVPMTNAQGLSFIAAVHAAGRKVGLYHSLNGFLNLGQDWDWVADWGTTPPPIPWTFWQYQGSPLDRDKFSGDLASLRALAGVTGGDTMPMPMLSFSQPLIGGAHLVGPGTAIVPLDGSPWDGPWPAGTNFSIYGEATFPVPLPGGVAGEDRVSFLMVRPATKHDGTPWTAARPAALLKKNTDWPIGLAHLADPTPFSQADVNAAAQLVVDAAIATDRAKARVTWG
jgi:Glycosyl hydrolases family 25